MNAAPFRGETIIVRERQLRALSHVDRHPLFKFLAKPRSALDVQREFPGVPVLEVRRSLAHLEASHWIRKCGMTVAEGVWALDAGAVNAALAWIVDTVPTVVPSPVQSKTQLAFELVVLRRQGCRAVLGALHAGASTHSEVIEITGLQSGTVSDALGRLQVASIIQGYRPTIGFELHVLRFLKDALVNDEESNR